MNRNGTTPTCRAPLWAACLILVNLVPAAVSAAVPPVPSQPVATCAATVNGKCYVNGSFTLTSSSAGAHHYHVCRSDDVSGWGGCAQVIAQFVGSSYTVSGVDVPSDGSRRAYYFKACDAANNCTSWGDNDEVYVFMDATGPTAPGPTTTTCNYVSGSNCWVTGNFIIGVTPATDGGSGVNPNNHKICRSEDHTSGFAGCQATMADPGGTSFTVSGSNLPSDGQRRSYWFKARDWVGNSGDWNTALYVWVDRYNPTVSANNASPEWFASRTVTMTAADATGGATANSGLKEVRYRWNVAHDGSCTSGTATTNGATISVPAGDNHLYLCARDNTGRIGSWNGGPYRVQAQAPWSGQPVSLPGRVQAENYDLGGEGQAYHDTSPGNIFGVYRTHSMDVGAIPSTSGGGYHIGNIETGEWAEYQVNITQTQNYELLLRLSSGYSGTTRFRFLLDGVDISGAQTVASTGGWDAYVQRTIPVGTLNAGNLREIRLSFEEGSWNLDWFELRPSTCAPPAITSHPASRSIEAHQSWTFAGAASGSPAPALQWLKDGQIIPGATGSTLTITDAREDDIGSYKLHATNACGTADSIEATLDVRCSKPLFLVESLTEVFQNRPAVCDWRSNYAAQYPNSIGGGSDNLPVLAAAIALVADPNLPGPDSQHPKVSGWWEKYLSGELGDRGSEWYYGAKEPFSYVYQHFNILSVMAVHHQANRAGLTNVRDLARRWLRATFSLQAAVAAPGPVSTFHDRDVVCPSMELFNGPYLPMAGMRSAFSHWGSAYRGLLFAHAAGINTNDSGAPAEQDALRSFLEGNWSGPGGSVYGLTAAEAAGLASIRTTGQLPAFFNAAIAGIRTIVPYHIVAWPGVRVTLMESNRNFNTVPTYGVAFFSSPWKAGGNEAHFLYPWNRGTTDDAPCVEVNSGASRRCISRGMATLNLSEGYMEATNGCPSSPGCSATCDVSHPEGVFRIDNLPSGVPEQYHITLTP